MPERELFRWQVRSFTVRLALDAVDRLAREIESPRRFPIEEQGGILFGRVLDNDNVEVEGFEFYQSGHRRGIPYDLNRIDRRRIQLRVADSSDTPGQEVLGFFRTHLRPGLFLDQRDFGLMMETFSDCPGIALLIRPGQSTHSEAGIFFWEDGDIERKQSELVFPLDANALRAQGPIDIAIAPPESEAALSRWRPTASHKSLLRRLPWGLVAGALAFVTFAELHDRPENRPQQTAPSDTAPADTAPAEAKPEVLAAPPAAFSDEAPDRHEGVTNAPVITDPDDSPAPVPIANAAPDTTAVNEAPRTRWVAPEEQKVSKPAPAVPPPPVQVASSSPPPSTNISALAATAPELSAPVPPPAARSSLAVDVSIEPRQGGVLKRVTRSVPSAVGHVPLLGRLPGLRHANDEIVAAKADSGLEPKIPAALTRTVDDDVDVDVAASIDESGTVTNTEITRGGESQLSVLAENAVRRAAWKPARTGDHNVAMDVVVHYRFSPNHDP